jgi:hypothetical protein
MCFSAGASITAGALLTVVGVETLKKVHKPAQLVFASLPLFFAFQQFTEGVLWIAMGRAGYGGLQTAATYAFLTLSQMIWPVAVPLSVLLIEEGRIRKKILYALLAIGIFVFLFNLFILIFYKNHAEIIGMHIAYVSNFNIPLGIAAVITYSAVTIAPLFISSIRRMHVLGTIMAVSLLVSLFFYTQCLTSVWCFFAAIISFMVYYIVRDAHTVFNFNLAEALKKIIKNV